MRHILIWLALLAVAPVFVFAQTEIQPYEPDVIAYTMQPETPGPNQSVQLSIDGIGSFVGDAQISWTQDGKQLVSGVGVRTASVTTGPLGSKTVVHVSVRSASQGNFEHNFIIVPSLVNLIWEADTSVPPLFRGKPLFTGGSQVMVVAFPQVVVRGAFISSKALSYQWSLNGDKIPEQSGVGRNTFTFIGDQLKNSESVEVVIQYNGVSVGGGTVTIGVTDPQLVVYERDSLRGELLDTAMVGSNQLTAKEITLQAEPYYFSNSKTVGAIRYTWTLNDDEVTGPDSSRGILTLRQTGSGSGIGNVSVTAQNTNSSQLVQSATATLQLLFGSRGTTTFGL